MVFIQKANGEREVFSQEKLRASIKRAGIPSDIEDQVVAHVMEKLREDMPTSEIYQHIIEFLNRPHLLHHKAKYSLKQSIMELGPTGFPFEKFVARLLEKEGYRTETNVITVGTCIHHEIDVVAKNDQKSYMVEAKFHNTKGIKTDVHVSLYTKARFDDTKEKNHFTSCLLVTNTKITSDAISYAQCAGMEVMSWEYPEGESLRDQIEMYHLHPITSLNTISSAQKQKLLEQNIVLCSELLENVNSLLFDIPEEKKELVIQEARLVSLRQDH